MKSMLRYMGAKHRLAKHYGPPRREVVVEPFAGSAGYSTYWNVQKAILVEKDARIYGIWNWLINEAAPADIMALDAGIKDLRDADYPPHIRDFIGYWMNRAGADPNRRISPANRAKKHGYWNAAIRNRVAAQLPLIKGWEIIRGDYTAAPDIDAHYHVDPPYQKHGGHRYRHGSGAIDYAALAGWCKSKECGDVCDTAAADWLPFEKLADSQGQMNRGYAEAVYRIDGRAPGDLPEKLQSGYSPG